MALPAISTGVYGYPPQAAAEAALQATTAALAVHPAVVGTRFWLFDETAYEAFAVTLASL